MPDPIAPAEPKVEPVPPTEPIVEPDPPVEPGPEREPTEPPAEGDVKPVEPEPNPEPVKTFTQEELEAEIGKRLARQERKLKRDLATPDPIPLNLESNLDPESFASTELYVDALATEKADSIIAHKEAQATAVKANDVYETRVEKVLDKYPDYDAVISNPKLHISTPMRDVIMELDTGPDIAYHLGSNPAEAQRISTLAPVLQVAELVELGKTLSKPAAPIAPKAPDPITPVHGKATTTPAYDTTDPRSVKQMSASEWIVADRARRAKAYKEKGFK